MDSIDKLLNEIKNECTQTAKPKLQQSIQNLTPIVKSGDFIDNLLASVKTEFDEIDRTEQLKKQREAEELEFKKQLYKQQQLDLLKKQAQKWLDSLDPLSPEGLWFERFAENYPTKLQAAIEYLQHQ